MTLTGDWWWGSACGLGVVGRSVGFISSRNTYSAPNGFVYCVHNNDEKNQYAVDDNNIMLLRDDDN